MQWVRLDWLPLLDMSVSLSDPSLKTTGMRRNCKHFSLTHCIATFIPFYQFPVPQTRLQLIESFIHGFLQGNIKSREKGNVLNLKIRWEEMQQGDASHQRSVRRKVQWAKSNRRSPFFFLLPALTSNGKVSKM